MPRTQRTERRSDALSKERIVEAAIEILDAEGENARLFQALTARLSTGVGAIYHHVANKNDLLAAAANTVIVRVMTGAVIDSEPRQAIRGICLGIFDAIDTHPWVGTQLSREPGQPAVLQIWEGLGARLHALGLAGSALADAGSALVNYVLGSAAQHAAGPGRLARDTDRTAFLDALARGVGAARPRGIPDRTRDGVPAPRARRPRAIPRRSRHLPGRDRGPKRDLTPSRTVHLRNEFGLFPGP